MRAEHRYRLTFLVGYDSYVGDFVRALRDEGAVEFIYRFCSSGHSKLFNKQVVPGMPGLSMIH